MEIIFCAVFLSLFYFTYYFFFQTDRLLKKTKCGFLRVDYIGSNATILPNIKICDYVIIGAGAVVTKDVPPFSIVAGNPAKTLKQFKNAEEIHNYFRSKQNLK